MSTSDIKFLSALKIFFVREKKVCYWFWESVDIINIWTHNITGPIYLWYEYLTYIVVCDEKQFLCTLQHIVAWWLHV